MKTSNYRGVDEKALEKGMTFDQKHCCNSFVTGCYTCVYYYYVLLLNHVTHTCWTLWLLYSCTVVSDSYHYYIGAVSIPILWLWQNLLYCPKLSLEKADWTTGPFTLNTADFNHWAEATKLKFFKVCLIGRAQSVFQCLRWPGGYLLACYGGITVVQPALKCELYLMELSTRRRRPTELG